MLWKFLYSRRLDCDRKWVKAVLLHCILAQLTYLTCHFLYYVADRYRLLPSARHQLQFVQLQLDLLDDYRVRLLQIRGELQSPLSSDYCSILNTVAYIIGILQQWTNQPVSLLWDVVLLVVLSTLCLPDVGVCLATTAVDWVLCLMNCTTFCSRYWVFALVTLLEQFSQDFTKIICPEVIN